MRGLLRIMSRVILQNECGVRWAYQSREIVVVVESAELMLARLRHVL
jgi:hypothetical protein